ncbi:dolichyl-phosphate beta-glucosyltransferase [Streptomyces tropicalis]|uniref:dolichyl-phosphate beta-glucosyltransferase n=1 Tax=Streptomyces tropicalis TaxID=3034234 RepID=A0ABT6A7W7_9ACTN|nr:dolichyl-phosphate beta-glucosyltransferase [Streptomyces tropicalis]MDF3300748.1 glycosyltransferase family 2 protein [Streptomyces tropicalis]
MSRSATGVVDLSVVVPAYNEERRLGPTLDAVGAYLTDNEGRFGSWEIVVADDGSTDGTGGLVTARQDPRVRLVAAERNRGKGHALRIGVAATRGRRVLVTDADLAAPIEELEHLDKALVEGCAAAIGSRSVSGATIESRQHRVRELLGRAGNLLIRRVAVPGIRDTQCGFKLFDGDLARTAFAASRLDGWGIDVEVLQHFHRAGWPVAEVPVRWSHQSGSKVGALDYGRVLGELARLKARSLRPADLLATALFLLMAVALYSGRLVDPGHRYLPDSLQDQNQWEWFFAVTADSTAHLRNPFFSDLQGFPDGVNLMANTAMLGLSVPFTPVTLLLGPAVALSVCMTLGLAATAVSWYWLIVRRVVRRRAAACVGAALAAFAPPMVSHANAHPNFVILFMIPLLIDRALRLCEGTRVRRDGIVLGLMAAYQIFLGEEPLLLAAIGMALFAAAYAAARPDVARRAWRPLLRGLLIGAAVCLPVVAYPLHWQFAGPQSYRSVLHGDNAGNSPLALLAFAERSLAGNAATANRLSLNPTEQNAFYGWPLALLAFAITVRLWERALVRALAVTAAGAALLSLGPRFRIPLTDTVYPGPWALLAHRPLFESVIEGRVAMVCAPALGLLVALALDRLAAVRRVGTLYTGLLAVSLALLPIVPAPLRTEERPRVPEFIADGLWKPYVRAGESLVPVPLPDPAGAEALHWQTAAHLGFRLPGGYFNGPYGPDRIGIYGASPRYTSDLLRDVRYSGSVPAIGPNWRAQARADFAFWHAGVLVLAPQPNDGPLRETVSKLVGRPGRWTGGVWVWDLHEGR